MMFREGYCVYARYGSIAGAIEMYDFLVQAHDKPAARNWLPQWLSMHPDTQERQKNLREYAQEKGYTHQGSTQVNPWRKTPPHAQ